MSSMVCRRVKFKWEVHKEAIKWPSSIPNIQHFEHHAAWRVHLMLGVTWLTVQRWHWHSRIVIKLFNITRPINKLAVPSNELWIHCTTACTLTLKYQVFCLDPRQTRQLRYHHMKNSSGYRSVEWAGQKKRPASPIQNAGKQHCTSILLSPCWNGLEICHECTTSSLTV